uniref:Uncharacterized protein n=1 Tax=Latimeria chalumnae TaxID=7897 RepID=H3B501_LATCH
FDESKENFDSYLEQFEHWLAVKEILDEKRRDVFLPVLEPTVYGLLKSLTAPDMSYTQLIETLSRHYKPKPIPIAEWFWFYCRNQEQGETIANYILALKHLASTCEFGFVCGLRGESYHKQLLLETELTFKSACDIALALELAHKDTKELAGHTESPRQWNELQSMPQQPQGQKKPQPQASSTKPKTPCYWCGGSHQQGTCRFRHERCHGCGKTGHLKRVCQMAARMAQTQYITDTGPETRKEEEPLELFTVYIAQETGEGICLQIGLGDQIVSMQLDTGVSVLLVPEHIYKKCLGNCPLQPSWIQLTSYTGEVQAPVTYEGGSWTLPLMVVQGKRPALLGRNWLEKIRLNWNQVFTLSSKSGASSDGLQKVLEKHAPLFQEGYGTITDFKVKIWVKEGATPIFHKSQPVLYALREAIEKELDRLERHSIISLIEQSEWAAPIVVVPKKDKSVRLCGNYKVTMNHCMEPEPYPLSYLFATLASGKYFSKLDLYFANQQLELVPESEPFLTINTHKGLYRYQRLAYRVSTVPAIFQHTMDQILQGLNQVVWFLDDSLVTASTAEEHLAILDQVLARLQQYGVQVNRAKCQFLHEIDSQRLCPTEDKVAVIVNMPAPTNVTELRSFLGLLNYYGRLLANLSTLLQPHHELLQKDAKWNWSLQLACDASPYGMGAVISYVLHSGEEHPIAFNQGPYLQIEREALSIIFGVKKFHKYLYRWKFTLPYDYDIEYRRSHDHANADALSSVEEDDLAVFQISRIEALLVDCQNIAEGTRRDPVLSKVLTFILNGWPNFTKDPTLRPFFDKKDQLSTDQGSILWGTRVVIPPKYYLYDCHLRISQMKALAHWPGLDQDIQNLVSQCAPCTLVWNQPAAMPLHPWSWATTPWEHIHIDYAKVDKQHFLVVIDVHSKWIEVFPTQVTTTEKTMSLLRHLFASYDLPRDLVSDNGPQFSSQEFKLFLKQDGVRYILSPPYYLASNGAAERAVQTFKKAWIKQSLHSVSANLRLAHFLFTYHNTPHMVTECTPAELFLKQQPCTCLSLLKPDISRTMEKHQLQQLKGRTAFPKQERVMVHDFCHPKHLWIPGVVLETQGPLTYRVHVGDRVVHVQVDHLL